MADEMWLMLGDARMELGSYIEALAAYDRAIANGYFTAESIANYAEAKVRAGDGDTVEDADTGTVNDTFRVPNGE